MPDQRNTEYYRGREVCERAAAARAANPTVARLHMVLADQYKIVARGDETVADLVAQKIATYIILDD